MNDDQPPDDAAAAAAATEDARFEARAAARITSSGWDISFTPATK